MDSESSVKITYETLFEILMREKNRDEIQKLDDGFIENVVFYLNKKSEFLHKSKQGLSSFIEQGNESILSEIHNIQKLIKEIYNRRERKIIEMAINLAKSPNMLINTSNCLPNEIKLLERLQNILNKHREEILFGMMLKSKEKKTSSNIDLNNNNNNDGNQEKVKQDDINSKEIKKIKEPEEPKDLKTNYSSQDENTSETSANTNENVLKSVVFLKNVPELLDSELNSYGPFNKGDETNLPSELIELLSSQESIKLKEY